MNNSFIVKDAHQSNYPKVPIKDLAPSNEIVKR